MIFGQLISMTTNAALEITLTKDDAVDIINCSKYGISPDIFAKLQGCPPTSCVLDRSLSLFKKL